MPRTWGTDGLRALAREACRRRASKRDRGILADGWEYVEGLAGVALTLKVVIPS